MDNGAKMVLLVVGIVGGVLLLALCGGGAIFLAVRWSAVSPSAAPGSGAGSSTGTQDGDDRWTEDDVRAHLGVDWPDLRYTRSRSGGLYLGPAHHLPSAEWLDRARGQPGHEDWPYTAVYLQKQPSPEDARRQAEALGPKGLAWRSFLFQGSPSLLAEIQKRLPQ
jgi:hypothetical protein